MATSVGCTWGWGGSDGETVTAEQSRWATVSAFDVVGGASPLLRVPGILATGGNPLGVTQAATPAMKVTVLAGGVVVPSNNATKPPYGMVLEVSTDLDIAAAHATNPRIDLVIAKVYDHGDSTSAATIEILTGTAAAVPSRPTLPSGENHCISLATVTVPAAAATIVNANITKVDSDSWSTATSDAGYLAAPGGCVFKQGLVTMSSTRRQAWAAKHSPGTMWWDQTSRVGGVANGTDIVPLSIRKLYQVQGAATQQANSTTPVNVANSGTLTVFGGTRRVRVTMSGQMGTDRNDSTGWNAGRVELTSTGTLTLSDPCRSHARLWGDGISASTVSQHAFSGSWTFDVGAGTFSVTMRVLRVAGGGGGTGSNVICSEGALLVEDIGPA